MGVFVNNYQRIGTAILVVANLSACATVTRGTKQKYAITSEPSEAKVDLSLGQGCVTPCKLKLKRKEAFVATVSKPGYETQQINVRTKFSGSGAAAGAANILLGGIIGVGVDASNGSLNDLDPNPLNVVLKPVSAGPTMADTSASAVASEVPSTGESAKPAATAPVTPVADTPLATPVPAVGQ